MTDDVKEIEQLLERMIIPRFDALDRQLDYLIKRMDSIEAELRVALAGTKLNSAMLRPHLLPGDAL